MRLLGAVAAAILLAPPIAAHEGHEGPRAPALRNVRVSLITMQYGEGDGAVRVVPPGEAIPYRVGESCYGWQLSFTPVDRQIELDELLQIPEGAAEWGNAENRIVASDRMSARTSLVISGHAGQASHTWCVAEGDPEGPYTFVLSADGKVIRKVSFRVQRP